MRKIRIVIMVLIIAGTISGCGHKGLEEYKEALTVTSQINSGRLQMIMDLELAFNEEGLSEDAIRKLNEYKAMHLEMTYRYGVSDNEKQKQVQADTFFSIGGFGLDTTFYMDGERQAIRLPIINKLMTIEDYSVQEDLKGFSLENVAAQWTNVFNEEDVIVGQQDYIITEEGQIKTMTYTIKLTSEQLMMLFGPIQKKIGELSQEQLANFLHIEPTMAAQLKGALDAQLEGVVMTNLDGKAYVDFDGRLSRQTMELQGIVTNNKPGQLKSFNVSVQMDTDTLGEEQQLDFPEKDAYQWIEPDKVREAYESVRGL